MKIIVLGVSGSGKSTISKLLAERLGHAYYDGDDFHPTENIAKMKAGTPLNDNDRQEWLTGLNRLISKADTAVLACSALKPEYRDVLRHGNKGVVFVYLKGNFDTIWQRHQQRNNHYFTGKDMLASQFSALIEPSSSEAIIVEINQTVEKIIEQILIELSH